MLVLTVGRASMDSQAAHGEALEKCLQLERELQQVPVLKRQVEALKAGRTHASRDVLPC